MVRAHLLLSLLVVAACRVAAPLSAPVTPPHAVPEPSEPPPLAAEVPREEPAPPEACNPLVAPPERREGDLLVHAPPDVPSREFFGRLRTHTEGSLTKGSARTWIGPQVPGFMPLYEGTAELHLLERSGDDFVAIYRDPYGASSCTLQGKTNCEVVAVAYDPCGERLWTRRLDEVMSAPERLEIQDVRMDGGILYFNEACQSYSKESGGKCSSLVAYDPVAGQVKWRTGPLVSNNRFFVLEDYIVSGYGFTSERDRLFLVRRRDGEVVFQTRLPKAHEDITLDSDGLVVVRMYPGRTQRFSLEGLDGVKPRLVARH